MEKAKQKLEAGKNSGNTVFVQAAHTKVDNSQKKLHTTDPTQNYKFKKYQKKSKKYSNSKAKKKSFKKRKKSIRKNNIFSFYKKRFFK